MYFEIFLILAIMSSLLPLRPNVAGVRWSRYLYTSVTGMTESYQCGSLCMLAGNVICHYYLIINGTCYLGNVLTAKSIISSRNDTQNIYVAMGNKILVHLF